MRVPKGLIAAAAAWIGGAGVASADVVLQSVPDFGATWIGAYASDSDARGYRLYDTFTLPSDAKIEKVWFNVQTGSFDPANTGVEISFWSVSGGLPDAPLFVEQLTPADYLTTLVTPRTTTLEAQLSGFDLAAGTYDISFYNPHFLGVQTFDGGAGHPYWAGPYAGYFGNGTIAFALCTAGSCTLSYPAPAPEPATWALAMLGFVSLGLLGRRTAHRRLA